MRVLFRPDALRLLSLSEIGQWIGLGAIGRHRLIVEDEAGEEHKRAIAQWPAPLRQEWQDIIEMSVRLEGQETSYHEVVVTCRKESAWSPGTPELSCKDALAFLYRPYRLLLENRANDLAFLLCACEPLERVFLQRWLDEEWLEPEGGGIDELKKRAEIIVKHPSGTMRTAALLDSDDVEPKRPNLKSRRIEQMLNERGIYHHRLCKRAIENYLPATALERWVKFKQGPQRNARQKLVRAFLSLSDDERAYFYMKKGLLKDENQPPKTLFQELDTRTRAVLSEGFGDDIQSLYADGQIKSDEFTQDTAFRELRSFIQGLIQRIR